MSNVSSNNSMKDDPIFRNIPSAQRKVAKTRRHEIRKTRKMLGLNESSLKPPSPLLVPASETSASTVLVPKAPARATGTLFKIPEKEEKRASNARNDMKEFVKMLQEHKKQLINVENGPIYSHKGINFIVTHEFTSKLVFNQLIKKLLLVKNKFTDSRIIIQHFRNPNIVYIYDVSDRLNKKLFVAMSEKELKEQEKAKAEPKGKGKGKRKGKGKGKGK